MWKANLLQLYLLIILSCGALLSTQQDDDDLEVFQQEPVPDPFELGDRYPDRDEEVEVRPIKLRLQRTSRRFSETIINNDNNDLSYANDDARLMTSRLKSRLDILGGLYEDEYRRQKLEVVLTYAEEGNPDVTDPNSLHYEGRTARIKGRSRSELPVILKLAVQAGFDWVSYEDEDYCRVSVIPDVCQTYLDLLFLLDQSGSVGRRNHDLALDFMKAVVNFFEIGPDLTRVGVFTFSSGAREDFDLDRYLTNRRVTRAIRDIGYRGGYTHTALALNLATDAFNNPARSGARPVSDGIPRVVVLITDGRSNVYNITEPALNLLASGVTVYSVGIGNVDVDELRFIASDPDREHVFLLRSFTDAASFVQLLSGTTCDTPANVPPGTPTDGECDEDDFRYYVVECPAFTETVIVEQLDIYGICALYVSVTIVNPSPVDPTEYTFHNETIEVSRRTLFVTINAKKLVYVAVRGIAKILNRFQMTVYSMLFDQDTYTAMVPGGQIVEVIDLDIINDTDNLYTFSITAGNEGNRFEIDENGVISTTVGLNAEEQDFYNLTVEAYLTSNDCRRGRAYVEITVTANNQFPPVFQDTNPVTIPETEDIGNFVVRVTATDADFGVNGEVRYSITGGNIGGAFAIDPDTGDISVAAALNHTIQPSYTLQLTATDQAVDNPMTDTTTQVIHIMDVNQRPFFITLCAIENSCSFMVSEGASVNTTLETILAGDPDSASTPNGQLNYVLDPADTQFTINDMGQLSLTSTLDRETQDQYIFLLFVNDNGTPSLNRFTRVTIIVTDINDNRPILVAPDSVDVPEGKSVNDDVARVSAFDSDIGDNAVVIFSLTGTGSSFFAINSTTGFIRLIQSLDFETTTEHEVMVRASNPDGLSSEFENITFNVINENDNSPIFTMDPYTASVAEHSDPGTSVVTVEATDNDAGILGEVQYSIVGGNAGGVFSINSTTGEISISGDIDRESVTSFTLQVRAQDLGIPPRSDRASVQITITDINDNAPVFSPSVYFKMIGENAAIGTVLGIVTATDADEPGNPNSMFTYSIVPGNGADAFTISPSNGTISTASSLDFETVPDYILRVAATDMGDPDMNGTAIVNITVIDVNDMPPNISGNQTVRLSESTATPFAVAQFTATGEVGDNNMFTLNGMQDGEFVINQDNGIVTLVRSLDFEMRQLYEFEVVVSDSQFSISSFLTIIVLDENDNTPQFDPFGPFNVTEENMAGILVGQVTATDGDSGLNGEIQFSIVNNIGGNLFTINASTGMIRTAAVLDREALVNMNLFTPPESQQVLVVQAEDRGMPSLFSQADVTIRLLDINDNSPQFADEPPSSISFPENIPIGTFILDASATDPDLGANGEVSYSLTSDDTSPLPFSIDPSTGAVTTVLTLDREDIDQYTFTVTATDNGTPQRSSAAVVIFNVTDVNDNAPEFLENLPHIVAFTEGGNFDGGSVEITRLTARDRDIGRNAEIDYTLSPGHDPRFSIRDSGDMIARIRVSGSINFEEQGQLSVMVIATDRGEPPMSSIAEVIIVIRDRDEFLPMFRGSCNASIPESFPVGEDSIVTQCVADDRDGDDVFYEIFIEPGNPSLQTFRVNTTSGDITLRAPLDRETLDVYQFFFTATSSGQGGMVAEMPVRIDVTDVNDNAPVFTPSQIAVTYSDPQVRTIRTLVVSDDDINENGQFSVAITNVDRTNQPDGLDTHEIIITAEDMGTPSMSENATVVVTNGFPCQIMEFSLDTLDLNVDTLCSLTNPPVSQDYLVGTEVILDCSAVSNLPVTYQWQLDGSFITTPSSDPTLDLGQISFSDVGSYSCIARTTIGSIQSQTAVISVISMPVFIRPPENEAIEIDRLVNIPCVSDGVPVPATRFYIDGEPVELDTRVTQAGQFLVITRALPSDDGTYTCTAENSAGSITSEPARLIVFHPDNMVSTVIQLNNPSEDGTCHNLDSHFVEQLLENTTQLSVEVTNVTAQSGFCDSGPCYPDPCINGGTCSLNDNSSNGFECACPDTFTGDLCEVDVDECPILEPCLFGGNCTNTRGSFSCSCPSDRRGHRCQYQILCDDDSRCADGETCVETLANVNGFVCDSTLPSETLTIQLSEGVTEDVLSEAVYNVNDQLINNAVNNNGSMAKRQTSNSGDFCEPRFIETTTASVFRLVWGCPDGTNPPSGADVLEFICISLIEANLADSCTYPDGSTQEPPVPTSLQPIDVQVMFIILDDNNGVPLSGNQAVKLLTDTESQSALTAAGLTAEDFVTTDTSSTTDGSNEGGNADNDSDGVSADDDSDGVSGGVIAGIVIAVIVAIAVISVIVVIAIFAMRRRGSENIESGKRTSEAQTAQALQMPMLYKQTQRMSTAGGIIENPAYQSQPVADQPNITKLDGNTDIVYKSALTRISDDDRSTSTDNLLNS